MCVNHEGRWVVPGTRVLQAVYEVEADGDCVATEIYSTSSWVLSPFASGLSLTMVPLEHKCKKCDRACEMLNKYETLYFTWTSWISLDFTDRRQAATSTCRLREIRTLSMFLLCCVGPCRISSVLGRHMSLCFTFDYGNTSERCEIVMLSLHFYTWV